MTLGSNYPSGNVISREYDDVFVKATVFSCNDMVVTKFKKIASLDVMNKWQEQIIGMNDAGETVYVKTFEASATPPSWITSEVVAEVSE